MFPALVTQDFAFGFLSCRVEAREDHLHHAEALNNVKEFPELNGAPMFVIVSVPPSEFRARFFLRISGNFEIMGLALERAV